MVAVVVEWDGTEAALSIRHRVAMVAADQVEVVKRLQDPLAVLIPVEAVAADKPMVAVADRADQAL
jgi:hypothetical protein